MVMQTKTSGLLSGLGDKFVGAMKAAKGKPLEVGNAGLPAGIDDGVAKLVSLKLAVYKDGKNKGKPYFMGQGVVVLPKVHNGTVIEGRQTKCGPHPLCDTPQASGKKKTFADHFAFFRNTLLGLGLDIDQFEGTGAEREQKILAGIAALIKGKDGKGTHFAFRTWKGKKQTTGQWAGQEPRTNEDWMTACPAPSLNGDGALAAVQVEQPPVDNSDPNPDGAAEETTPEETQEETTEAGGEEAGDDLDALALVANDDANPEAKKANRRISDIANELGITDEDIGGIEGDWTNVVAAIREKQGGGEAEAGSEEEESAPEEEEEAPPEPEPWKPEVKGVVKYYPKKDGKPVLGKNKKPLEVSAEITAIDKKAKTCTLKRLDTKSVVKNVKLAGLEPV
jgi:hypothetical protein